MFRPNQQFIKRYVEQLAILTGGPYRGDCPKCGGKGTFTVSKKNGSLVWNCYRASCSTAGRQKAELSLRDIRVHTGLFCRKSSGLPAYGGTPEKLSGVLRTENGLVGNFGMETPLDSSIGVVSSNCDLPRFTRNILGNRDCAKFVEQHSLGKAYTDGRLQLRYDPKLHRIVFLVQNLDKQIVGAVGRRLDAKDYPKWYNYEPTSPPFTCQGLEFPATLVVVEDCVSAAVTSSVATGVALLGTTLTKSSLSFLTSMNPKRALVALDKDASLKSIGIHKELSMYMDSKIVLLDDDLKYYNTDQIRKKLEKYLI